MLDSFPHSPVIDSDSIVSLYLYGKAKQVLINGDLQQGWSLPDTLKPNRSAQSGNNPQWLYHPRGNYKVKMANRLEEVQYINQADLLVVNHDSSVKVLVDKYGEVQTVKQPLSPREAKDPRGNDVLALISSADLQTHDFDEEPDTTSSCMN